MSVRSLGNNLVSGKTRSPAESTSTPRRFGGPRHRCGRCCGPGSCWRRPGGSPNASIARSLGCACGHGAQVAAPVRRLPAGWAVRPAPAGPAAAIHRSAGRPGQGGGLRTPGRHELPLTRWSATELAAAAVRQRIVASVSASTVRRWLAQDAIKPWRYRSWIFPRDPDFKVKATRVLGLYARRWAGRRLRPDEYVLSADEKTGVQALRRIHPGLPTAAGRPARVEFEYRRGGTLAYLAAYDVHQARVFGRCEPTTGIAPFTNLVEQVMTVEPYASARRVFWIVDNGSSHAGDRSVQRMRAAFAERPAGPPARARQLAEPGRDLLLHPPTQGHHPRRRRPTSTNSPPGCWPSKPTTTPPPNPSTGPSPAPNSTPCSTASPPTPTRSRSRRNTRRTNGGRLASIRRVAAERDCEVSRSCACLARAECGRVASSRRRPKGG